MVSPNPAARIRSILRWQRGAPTSGIINAALVGSSSRTAARARGRSGCRAAVACRARETIPYGTGPSRLTGVAASCARRQTCRLSLAGAGVEERAQTVRTGLKVAPQWEPIRSDPRYHTLLKRMKLE